jgi:hypothetical protein
MMASFVRFMCTKIKTTPMYQTIRFVRVMDVRYERIRSVEELNNWMEKLRTEQIRLEQKKRQMPLGIFEESLLKTCRKV